MLGRSNGFLRVPLQNLRETKNSAWGHPDVAQKLRLHNNVGSSNSPIFDDDVKDCESDEKENELDLPDDGSD